MWLFVEESLNEVVPSLTALLAPTDVTKAVVYLLFETLNTKVKLLTAVAMFTPSLALNVRLNVPA